MYMSRKYPAINYIAVNHAEGTHRMSKSLEIIISENGLKWRWVLSIDQEEVEVDREIDRNQKIENEL